MTMRRLIDQLAEATYARDAGVRAQATKFYRDLREYLSSGGESAVARRLGEPAVDGTFIVKARAFTDVGPEDLLVVLAPSDKRTGGGIGSYRGKTVMVLRPLIAPGDLRHVATRLTQRTVEHEVTHLLDPGRVRSGGSAARADSGDEAGYYNEPGEWNAFWQEGAAEAERMIRGEVGQNPKVKSFMFGDGSLRGMTACADKFWDRSWLAAMTSVTRRRFDKRLAALWRQWKDEGLL